MRRICRHLHRRRVVVEGAVAVVGDVNARRELMDGRVRRLFQSALEGIWQGHARRPMPVLDADLASERGQGGLQVDDVCEPTAG